VFGDILDTCCHILQPIHKSKQEEAEAVVGLRELRNKIAFGLLLINGLLVLIIYLLQLNKRLLSFDFQPYGLWFGIFL
jgi:hypothetical protein